VRIESFDYELPADAIAQHPIEPRDAARLLVDRGPATEPQHRHVRDLPDLLEPGDVVVVNDSRVLPARLHLRRATGGAVEVVLLEPLDVGWTHWECLLRPARRMRPGEPLVDRNGRPVLSVAHRTEAGDTFAVRLAGDDPLALLAEVGEVPLPPYITAPLADPERYQTVYAVRPGSAAAPTAGLHFTPGLLAALEDRGVEVARVELAVGLDTFQPVTEPDPRAHRMHSERYRVPTETMDACRRAREAGGQVVAVGTTAARALESVAASGAVAGRTRLFIHAPYDWQVVDRMLTNFHLPRTTLLMMIDAFVGPRWQALYTTALAEGYRFLSFGDAMLLQRTLLPRSGR
jgi:S-adenosylmethionine:tRNA ribosyltransferase-isomerase